MKSGEYRRGALADDSTSRSNKQAAGMSGEPGDRTVDFIRFEYPEIAGAAFVPAWEGWDDPGAAGAFNGTGAQGSASNGCGASDGGAENPADLDSPDAISNPHSDQDVARLMG